MILTQVLKFELVSAHLKCLEHRAGTIAVIMQQRLILISYPEVLLGLRFGFTYNT